MGYNLYGVVYILLTDLNLNEATTCERLPSMQEIEMMMQHFIYLLKYGS